MPYVYPGARGIVIDRATTNNRTAWRASARKRWVGGRSKGRSEKGREEREIEKNENKLRHCGCGEGVADPSSFFTPTDGVQFRWGIRTERVVISPGVSRRLPKSDQGSAENRLVFFYTYTPGGRGWFICDNSRDTINGRFFLFFFFTHD